MEESKSLSLNAFKAASKSLCPRCRTGAVFTGKVYGLKIQKMNDHCPHCNLRFEREPGYFYVSMFVSYAMSVAEMVIACLTFYILTGIDNSFWMYLTVALGSAVLLSPFNYRYSRMILLYWLTPGLHFNPALYQTQTPAE